MKFKNVSDNEIYDITLVALGIAKRGEGIKPGDIIEVKDPEVIKRVQANGVYQEVKETVAKNVKEEKKGGK